MCPNLWHQSLQLKLAKKSIHTAKQTKQNAISGIGFLNASSSTGKTAFTSIQNDKYFSVSSSNSASVDLQLQMKLNYVSCQLSL